MNTNPFEPMKHISDGELLARVKQLVRSECQATASLVMHLSELEQRELYLAQGCASLYVYCVQVLHLAEHAAYNRIVAARAARRFPVILEMLAKGELHLAGVRLLAPHLTDENCGELLEAVRFRSKREIEILVARVSPKPYVPDSIRKRVQREPAVRRELEREVEREVASQQGSIAAGQQEVIVPGPLEPAPKSPELRPAAVVAPLAPERWKIQFTATAQTRDKLLRAQDLLRHRIPGGDLSQVFDRALDALLREIERQKWGAATRPGASRGRKPGSRHIPAAVRRAVWARDGERCTFVGPDGRRCAETRFLEIDHVTPHADGGPATVENCRVRCRAHNGYEARQYFGIHAQQDLPESREALDLEQRAGGGT